MVGRGGVLLFSLFLNREPKEDGGRNATIPKPKVRLWTLFGADTGFLPSPSFYWRLRGRVNSVIKNSPEDQQQNNRIDTGGYLGKFTVFNPESANLDTAGFSATA